MAKNELKLNRRLLDKDFEGYKLSLTSLPVDKVTLEDEVAFAEPSDDQFNYLYQAEYATQNHLIGDPWSSDSVYFIDVHGRVQGNCSNDRGSLDKCKEVYCLPTTNGPRVGRFAATLRFASEGTAVLSDGFGSISLLETGSRNDFTTWNLLHSERPFEEDLTFKVLDARHCSESRTFQVIISYITSITSKASEKQPTVGTVIVWLSFVCNVTEDSQWTKTYEKIECKGEIDYADIEPTGLAIYLASALPPSSTVETAPAGVEPMETPTDESVDRAIYDYHWQQTYDDVKLWLSVPVGTGPTEIRVETTPTSITVFYRRKPILTGKTYHCIEPDLVTWSILDDRLEVEVQKTEEGAMWQNFIDSDKRGKEIPDDVIVADIHSRLAHLCSENEEKGDPVVLNGNCPEECDASDKDRSMYRFRRGIQSPTHKVHLGNNQWLFNVRLSPELTSAFCMRNDVDGCVWQPTSPADDSTNWTVEHEGTILAFGYVQASKTNRKYSVASQDLSYVAVIETTGHVILYRKGVAVTNSLRNRKSGKTVQKIGMQNLVNLHTSESILGAAAFNDKFYVLSRNSLFMVLV